MLLCLQDGERLSESAQSSNHSQSLVSRAVRLTVVLLLNVMRVELAPG